MNHRSLAILIIIGTLGLFVACQQGSNPVNPGDTVTKFVSASVCSSCHVSKGNEWKQTGHANALESLIASGHAASYCMPCHVTGLDDDTVNSGYDDPDETIAARFGGVQCESCHGAGSMHIASKKPLDVTLEASMCGVCHSGAHNPMYDEWKTSAHAEALEVRETNKFFRTECLECHSADYIFADSVPEGATPFDFELGITCVVCHDPHSKENEYQLRAEPVQLCGSCHTAEGARPGSTPHHPNADVYQGTGGFNYPGKTYDKSAHSLFEEGCVTCHMWQSPFNATGAGEDAITGHTFKPVIQACQECHAGATDFDINGFQSGMQVLLDDLKAELDSATDNDKKTLSYERAKFNYDFVVADGSLGVHNPNYTMGLIIDALNDFEPGS